MASLDPRKKITGIFSRRRFQALTAAGVLSIGLGIGAVGGAFAAPPSQPALADVTPVASPAAARASNPSVGHGKGRPGRPARTGSDLAQPSPHRDGNVGLGPGSP